MTLGELIEQLSKFENDYDAVVTRTEGGLIIVSPNLDPHWQFRLTIPGPTKD